jgi:hypothetical protein
MPGQSWDFTPFPSRASRLSFKRTGRQNPINPKIPLGPLGDFAQLLYPVRKRSKFELEKFRKRLSFTARVFPPHNATFPSYAQGFSITLAAIGDDCRLAEQPFIDMIPLHPAKSLLAIRIF